MEQCRGCGSPFEGQWKCAFCGREYPELRPRIISLPPGATNPRHRPGGIIEYDPPPSKMLDGWIAPLVGGPAILVVVVFFLQWLLPLGRSTQQAERTQHGRERSTTWQEPIDMEISQGDPCELAPPTMNGGMVSTRDHDFYIATGTSVGSWMNTRTGVGPCLTPSS